MNKMGRMQEVEVKILEVDVADIKKQLAAAGAKVIGEYEQQQTVFYKEGFKGIFRIRKSTDTKGNVVFYTTLKSNPQKGLVKQADEREKTVANWEEGEQQAAALGFTKGYHLKKHRIEYQIENVQFCLDTIHEPTRIPTYLEIEAEDEMLVVAWAEKLGVNIEEAGSWGTKEVLKHYGAYK